MELKRITDEFVETVNKTMESVKSMAGAVVFDEYMEPEQVEMMQNMFKLTDTSLQLIAEQSKTMVRIEEKLDKLLERSEN